jgi:hypothetical protein
MRAVVLGIVLGACNGGAEEPTLEPGSCDGDGTEALELGEGGRDGFVAFEDGDALYAEDFGGTWSIYVELYTNGIDTTEAVTAVVRTSVDGGPTSDALGQQILQCDDAVGRGWTGVFAPLPDSLQADPSSAEGAPVVITATVTDTSGDSATAEVQGVLAL